MWLRKDRTTGPPADSYRDAVPTEISWITHRQTASGPEGLKLEVDNRYVRVYRPQLPAHGKLAARDYVDSCVVYLTDVDELITSAHGHVKEVRHKYGDVDWIQAGRYASRI